MKNELMSAAKKRFTNDGYGAPLTVIARDAGITAGAAYYYFGSSAHDALYAEFLRDIDERLHAARRAALVDDTLMGRQFTFLTTAFPSNQPVTAVAFLQATVDAVRHSHLIDLPHHPTSTAIHFARASVQLAVAGGELPASDNLATVVDALTAMILSHAVVAVNADGHSALTPEAAARPAQALWSNITTLWQRPVNE
jgi:AcrR family transcriptional regulator